MIRNYLRLRNMGHERGYSFKVASTRFVVNVIGVFFGARPDEPDEVKVEEELSDLEEKLDPNYKSNMRKPMDGFVYDGPTLDGIERYLLNLHPSYVSQNVPFSPAQVRRYEAVLEKLPEKYAPLLKAIETNNVEEYWRKKDKSE